jgi:hypothetical protein
VVGYFSKYLSTNVHGNDDEGFHIDPVYVPATLVVKHSHECPHAIIEATFIEFHNDHAERT